MAGGKLSRVAPIADLKYRSASTSDQNGFVYPDSDLPELDT